MRLIKIIDKQNYGKNVTINTRIAVRGIIFIGDKVLMIQSDKYQEYKFPGGGVEKNESDIDTLIREVREETGCEVIPSSIKEYGKMIERRIDTFDSSHIFEMESRYYLCQVEDKIGLQCLDDYEAEYGYHICNVSIKEAIAQNTLVMPIEENAHTWVERELVVLNDLLINR